jgi:hypothetical protein
MVSTYLSSKKIIDSLLANPQFVNLAKILVNSDKGTPKYLETYDTLNALLLSLGINQPTRVNIIKSDGSFWYSNRFSPDSPILKSNINVEPEVFLAVNYTFGNPICNKKLYPLELQSSVCSGYGFATRNSTFTFDKLDFVAKTYKPTSSPLSTDVFTLRVIQPSII